MYWRQFSQPSPLLWVGAKGLRSARMSTPAGACAGEGTRLLRNSFSLSSALSYQLHCPLARLGCRVLFTRRPARALDTEATVVSLQPRAQAVMQTTLSVTGCPGPIPLPSCLV